MLYDKHTLQDTYKYGKLERRFQWDKISVFWIRWRLFRKGMTGTGCCGITRARTGCHLSREST
ncbi:MAG: hypothetical protein ACLU4J_23555 [Butyricimonas paravirosa]